MDVLADVLKSIRLSASTYFCTEFSGPWGMDIESGSNGLFHAVIDGQCWLNVGFKDQSILLEKGDVVAFPTGGAHWISDEPGSERLPGAEVVESVVAGANPFTSNQDSSCSGMVNLLCGYFHYDTKLKHPLLFDLPCFIHIQAKQIEDSEWISALIHTIAKETRDPQPGSLLLVNRMCEILFVQLLRQHFQKDQSDLGYLRALDDTQIGKALNLIHAETSAEWSVESLANTVALSRTAFSERFTALVSISPKQYLTRWRMQRAKALLEETKRPMIDAAESAGYASEASFNKAFKAFFGYPPGQVRA